MERGESDLSPPAERSGRGFAARILPRKEADQNLALADESDVLNRGAVAKLLAEDAQRRAEAAKAAAGLGDGGTSPG